MGETAYTGAALEKALASKEISTASATLHLIGMVKTSDQAGHVAFTATGCENWVDIPTESIERAEQIGNQRCHDHSHPLMRLSLKQPSTGEGRLLAALLAQHGSTVAGGGGVFSHPPEWFPSSQSRMLVNDLFNAGIGWDLNTHRRLLCWGGTCGPGCYYKCCRAFDGTVRCYGMEPPIMGLNWF